MWLRNNIYIGEFMRLDSLDTLEMVVDGVNESQTAIPNNVYRSDERRRFISMKNGSLCSVYEYLLTYIQRPKNGKEIIRGQRKFILDTFYRKGYLVARWSQDIMAKRFGFKRPYISKLTKNLEELGYIKKIKLNNKIYYVLGSWEIVDGKKKETLLMSSTIRKNMIVNRITIAKDKVARFMS